MGMLERFHLGSQAVPLSTAPPNAAPPPPQPTPVTARSIGLRWLLHDIPYIAMLLLALVGVVFRLSVTYWVILIPVFAVISVAEGWRHFVGEAARLGLAVRVALSWCALLLAIYLLFGSGVRGVMNANATSLTMMILLGLGTFVSGVQARVWQICLVGGALFLAVPALGWLDQSPLLLTAGAALVIVLSGLAWWLTQWGQTAPAEARRRTAA